MKPEHKDLNPTELCLLTWYQPDNPLYRDPEHPTIKLAGEIGELLDLWAKDKYKPNFGWLNICTICEHPKASHPIRIEGITECDNFVPPALDELGDIWYYLRILAWQADVVFLLPDDWYHYDNLDCIKEMFGYACGILFSTLDEMEPGLQEIYYYINILLANLDYTLEQLTELNYYKLNSDETNHGWKDAR